MPWDRRIATRADCASQLVRSRRSGSCRREQLPEQPPLAGCGKVCRSPRFGAASERERKDGLRLIGILQELRDGQKLQIERQAEALATQPEQFELVRKQTERTERI